MEAENKRCSISADIEPETKRELVSYAKNETDGNLSLAVRKILREFLSKYKVRG